MRISDENLRGRAVVSSDGQVIGTVEEIFLDSKDWHIESLRVELKNDTADRIGIHRSVFRHGSIEVPVRLIQSVGDALVLTVALDGLRPAVDLGGEEAPFH
jgi:sporulation protein YlmC with PRC-barrel domain